MVGWQGPFAKVFSRLARQLQALQLQLAPGLALEPLKPAVQALHILFTVDLFSIRWSPRTFQELKPALREAVVAATREIVGCNAALQRFLAAGDDAARTAVFTDATFLVEAFAETLLRVLSTVQSRSSSSESTPGDRDLTYRVASAGVIVLQSGAVAWGKAQARCPGSVDMAHAAIHVDAVEHLLGFLWGMHPRHQQAVAVLRSTTHGPDAVLSCLRQILLPGPLDAQGAPRRGVSRGVFVHLLTGPVFEPEREAIKADVQLQTAIASRLGAIVRCRIGGASSAAPTEVSDGVEESDFRTLTGVSAMWESQLLVDCLTGCAYGPLHSLPETAVASLDHIDRLLPKLPEAVRADGQCRREGALAAVGHLVDLAFRLGRNTSPPLTASVPALRALRWEAGILMKLLQSGAAEHAGQAAESLHSLLYTIMGTASDADDNFVTGVGGEFQALPRELCEELIRASDFLARVAAKTLAPRPTILTAAVSTEQLLQQCRIAVMLFLDRAYFGLPPGTRVSGAELIEAAEGLVGTAVKATLRLAGLGPGAERIDFLRRQLLYSSRVVSRILSAQLAGSEDRGSSMPPGALRRWQALAWSLANAVLSPASPLRPHFYFSMLISALRVPGVSSLLLGTQTGRQALFTACKSVVGADYEGRASDLMAADDFYFLLDEVAGDCSAGWPELGLALARGGILTRMATCVDTQDFDGPSLVFTSAALYKLISAAAAASGRPEIQEACQLLNPISMGIAPCPDYWQRMQSMVTIPLASALAGSPAEEVGGNPATDAALGVQVAEALATRPCGYIGCIAVDGGSEADLARGKRCSGCELLRYCSKECQKADWRAHKAACRELQRRSSAAA